MNSEGEDSEGEDSEGEDSEKEESEDQIGNDSSTTNSNSNDKTTQESRETNSSDEAHEAPGDRLNEEEHHISLDNLGLDEDILPSSEAEIQQLIERGNDAGMAEHLYRLGLRETAVVRVLAVHQWHAVAVQTMGYCTGCTWCTRWEGNLSGSGWPGWTD